MSGDAIPVDGTNRSANNRDNLSKQVYSKLMKFAKNNNNYIQPEVNAAYYSQVNSEHA